MNVAFHNSVIKMKYNALHSIFAIFLLGGQCLGSPEVFTVPFDNWYTTVRGPVSIPTGFGKQAEASVRWGLEDAYIYEDNLLPGTRIDFKFMDNQFSPAVSLGNIISAYEEGATFIPGNPLSDVIAITGQACAVYGISQVTGTANTVVLSNKSIYPFVSRIVPPATDQAGAALAFFQYYREIMGLGWDKVALFSTTDGYGISQSNSFIKEASKYGIEIADYQQFLSDATDLSVEMREIKDSGARIIVTYAFPASYSTVVTEALKAGLIGDDYVWLVGDTIVGFSPWLKTGTTELVPEILEGMRGDIGTLFYLPNNSTFYFRYLDHWQSSDPSKVPGSGPGTSPPPFPTLYYDVGYLIGLIVNTVDQMGLLDVPYLSAEVWTNATRSQTFEGASGPIIFNEIGERPPKFSLVNFRPEQKRWVRVAIWEPEAGIIFTDDPIWHDNTTDIPDLDIRPPFHYWSCKDGERRYDPTGKMIDRQTPDNSNVDEIDSAYYCDGFMDCKNLSDESSDGCITNYSVAFIVFGIITGILILIAVLFIPFTIVFGFIVRRRRFRAASPLFLLLIIFSCIIGYASTFAWYGKPHLIGCNFQPWLLGISVISMISVLCAKTFRIWRIFRNTMDRTVITDFALLALWIIMIIPSVFILILWSAISTPTAEIKERDGNDHYLCTTGGITGEPGGFVFFFILVGYNALILFFAAFLSIVTRHVPSLFNESRLIVISIYNLVFLSVVVIPVFLVLEQINPFAAWIIRTSAILYAFTVTLWLQFIPKIIGVLIIDRCKEHRIIPNSLKSMNTPMIIISGSSSNSD